MNESCARHGLVYRIMKRFFLFLITICMVTFFTSCDKSASIEGTWITDAHEIMRMDKKKAETAEMSLTFDADGNVKMLFDVVVNQKAKGMNMIIGMKYDLNGKYEKTNEKVKLDIDAKSQVFDFYKFELDLSPELEAAIKAEGMTKEQLKADIKEKLAKNPFKPSINGINGEFDITEMTDTSLVLAGNKDKSFTFKRK